MQNIIQAGDGLLLTERGGVTFVVGARFRPSGERTLDLTFETAQATALNVSNGVEALIAPALLPRSSWQQQLLLGLKEVRVFCCFSACKRCVHCAVPQAAGGASTLLFHHLAVP